MSDDMALNVRLAMESSSFQQQITTINRQMTVVQAEFQNASTALNGFGSETERLEGQAASLTTRIQMSQQKVDLLTAAHERARQVLAQSVQANEELRQRVERTTNALEESTRTTGANSAESIRLRTELNSLNAEFTQSSTIMLRNSTTADNLNIRLQNTQTIQNRLQAELNTTNADLENQRNSMNDLGQGADEAGGRFEGLGGKLATFGKVAAAGIAAVALAIGALVVKSVGAGEELQKSLNGIQSATGYSDESMTGMKDTMLSIYNNNFGEDFADIGKSIQEVGKMTGLTGKKLEEMTTNALLLRDTFEYEVADSTKAATMLMNQFGESGTDAFNLIAQGAQWGLDKDGALLDSIGEYSVQFAQAGFSAEEMFNMFSNGMANGALSTDKIGDAIKEFGIRSKDGSDSSRMAFASLGLDADVTFASFAKGGESAKKSFDEVNKKLFEMKDPLEQNATGTALFGSLWEDMGVKGIKALSDTNTEISKTIDSLGKINSVKYNTSGEAMAGIKRNLETGILMPISDKVLPKLTEFSNFMIANMPKIKNEVSFAMTTIRNAFESAKNAVENVGNVFNNGVAFVKKYQDILIPLGAGIAGAGIAFGIYSLALGVASVATGAWATVTAFATGTGVAFTAVMAVITSPITLVVVAIGLLVAAFIVAYKNIDGFRELVDKSWSFIQSKTKEIFEGYIMPFIKDQLMPLFTKVFNTIGDVVKGCFTLMEWAWNNILKPLFIVLMAFIENVMVPVWKVAFGAISGLVSATFKTIGDLWDKSLKPILNGILDFVSGVFTGNWSKAWSGVVDIFKGIWEGMKTIAKVPINFIIGGLNGFINGINKIKIPDWVPTLGGKGFTIPNIPSFALGTDYFAGGLAQINERGGEILNLPRGTQVIPHDISMEMAKNSKNKTPTIIQLILQDGKAIAEYLIEDIDNLLGKKNQLIARGMR